MLRIGVDASCWINERGYGRFTRELLKAMTAMAPHRYVFFIDALSAKQCQFPENVEVHEVATGAEATRAASSDGYRSPVDMLRMGRAVSRETLDILLFPASYSYFPVWTSAKKMVTIHDVIPEMYPEMVFPNRQSRFMWNLKTRLATFQSDRILTVSNYSKAGIEKYLHIDGARIDVTVEAADACFAPQPPARIDEVRKTYRIDADIPYFLYVGGIGAHKNLRGLLAALAILREQFTPLPFKLVIVGNIANDAFWMDAEIQAMARTDDPATGVIFTGYVPEEHLPPLYSGATALIMPSFSEGFGLPALEAMACGTPVLASEPTSLPEVVGEAGLYFDPYSAREIADRMARLWQQPELQTALRKKAVARAATFSWNNAAEIVLQCMNKMAGA